MAQGFEYQLILAQTAKKLTALDETQVRPCVLVDLMEEKRPTGKERTNATQRILMTLKSWVKKGLATKESSANGTTYYKIDFNQVKI